MAHILLAEDDTAMCAFLTNALERAGYTVTVKHNGLDALSALESDAAYNLLLTDIVMPGMDGIELAQKATKLRPAIKIMFITGFGAMTAGRHNPAIEDASLLAKPFHLNDLVAQVGQLLKPH